MSTPKEAHTKQYSHIGGDMQSMLDRFAVSELCKGWTVYRDNSEWMNYRSLFTDDAYVWTSKLNSTCYLAAIQPQSQSQP